jgi:hypothetical protein
VFDDRRTAVAALHALLSQGFERDRLGFAGPGVATAAPLEGEETEPDSAVAATATGSLAGGIVGGVLGAVVAILLPGVGPVVAGGVLAGFVAGAPAGAAIGGLGAALRDAGLNPRVAEFYEDQVHSGRFLVTVSGSRGEEAAKVMALSGGRVEGSLSRVVSRLTGSAPEPPPLVEGRFADGGFGERAAQELGAAYPDREVSYDRRSRRVRVVTRP